MRTFWGHFGSILVALWRPFGSLWAPLGRRWFHLSSLLHLGGTLFAPCAPCWWPLGSFSFPSGMLAAFWMDFVAFSKEFKRIFPLSRYWRYPSFFLMILNERSARASEASRARSSSSNPRLESVIAYSFREWRSNRFRSLMLIRAPAQVYFSRASHCHVSTWFYTKSNKYAF